MSQVLLFGGAQAVAVVPVASPRKSSPRSKIQNKQSFQNKLWATFTSSDVKYKSPHSENRYNIQCMSVQHASKSKVVVNPLALEDAKEPPIHLYKPKEPYTATIVSVERIVGPKAPGETCHIVIDHGGNVPYWEGQSYGIIPPGENPKKPGAPHNVRLYSIASTRYGDSFDGRTSSLCVRRAVYYDPETGKEDPSKNGVCSNFLCDSKPGDKVQVTGRTNFSEQNLMELFKWLGFKCQCKLK